MAKLNFQKFLEHLKERGLTAEIVTAVELHCRSRSLVVGGFIDNNVATETVQTIKEAHEEKKTK